MRQTFGLQWHFPNLVPGRYPGLVCHEPVGLSKTHFPFITAALISSRASIVSSLHAEGLSTSSLLGSSQSRHQPVEELTTPKHQLLRIAKERAHVRLRRLEIDLGEAL